MLRYRTLTRPTAVSGLALGAMLLIGGHAPVRAEAIDYACTGVHVSHRDSNPVASRETVTLRSKDNAFLVGLPGNKDPIEAQTVANNSKAIVMRADDLTIQYERLTGNLFVIHDDGHLTRLACAPRK